MDQSAAVDGRPGPDARLRTTKALSPNRDYIGDNGKGNGKYRDDRGHMGVILGYPKP